jgi:hypothetical protein
MITKHRNLIGLHIQNNDFETQENCRNSLLDGNTNDWKKEIKIDAETPLGLMSGNAIHSNFGDVISLIQKA